MNDLIHDRENLRKIFDLVRELPEDAKRFLTTELFHCYRLLDDDAEDESLEEVEAIINKYSGPYD